MSSSTTLTRDLPASPTTVFAALTNRIATNVSPAERRETLQAIGGFREPALVDRALAFSLNGDLKGTELLQIPLELSHTEENRGRVVQWVMQNYEVLGKRVPEFHLSRVPQFADGNDSGLAKRISIFLQDAGRVTLATAKQTDLVMERATLRATLREREQANVDRALAGLGARQPDAAR